MLYVIKRGAHYELWIINCWLNCVCLRRSSNIFLLFTTTYQLLHGGVGAPCYPVQQPLCELLLRRERLSPGRFVNTKFCDQGYLGYLCGLHFKWIQDSLFCQIDFEGVLFPYNGQVALWQQQAGRPEDNLVIWDYHVIVVLRLRANYVTMQPSVSNELPELCVEKSWIYDYDTLLPKPCRWQGQCCSACVHCAQGSETHSCDRLRPFNFFI